MNLLFISVNRMPALIVAVITTYNGQLKARELSRLEYLSQYLISKKMVQLYINMCKTFMGDVAQNIHVKVNHDSLIGL